MYKPRMPGVTRCWERGLNRFSPATFRRNLPCQRFGLWLPAAELWDNIFLLHKLLSLWLIRWALRDESGFPESGNYAGTNTPKTCKWYWNGAKGRSWRRWTIWEKSHKPALREQLAEMWMLKVLLMKSQMGMRNTLLEAGERQPLW